MPPHILKKQESFSCITEENTNSLLGCKLLDFTNNFRIISLQNMEHFRFGSSKDKDHRART